MRLRGLLPSLGGAKKSINRMQAVAMDPKFHKHDPTHMIRALSTMIQNSPQFSGFWQMSNTTRMDIFSIVVVQFLKQSLAEKNAKRMLYIRLLIEYLKKNKKFTGRLNAKHIAKMVYDLTVERYNVQLVVRNRLKIRNLH